MTKYHTQQKGAAMLIFMLLFVVAGTALSFLLARSVYSDLQLLNALGTSKRAFIGSESLAEDMAYRYVFGTFSVDTIETLTWDGASVVATSTVDAVTDDIVVGVTGVYDGRVRKSQVRLALGAGTAFNYGLQAGNGGITLANSAGVVGNVYSNGRVQGAGSSIIRGDVVSAGPTGYIDSIHATGSAFAHTIEDSLVEGDLNVASPADDISNSVNGVRNHAAADQPLATFPFDAALIQDWKDAVTDFGTTIAATDPECSGGTYTIDDPATIGYLKVECNLDIKDQGSPATVLTVTGPVWVEGNLSFTQGPDVVANPPVNRKSVQFIVDNESNRLTSSQIEIRNSTSFTGSGHENSYILLLSANESSSLGGSEVAIDVSQSATGDVLVYAADGLVDIGNGIDLKEVTAHQINVAQNSDIIYESGLANLLFTSGPGGSYVLTDWRETF